MKRLKTREQYVKALIEYYKSYFTDGGFPSVLALQKEMIKLGICPRCGTKSNRWSSDIYGHFPCYECGFRITDKEREQLEDGKYTAFKRRMKERKND